MSTFPVPSSSDTSPVLRLESPDSRSNDPHELIEAAKQWRASRNARIEASEFAFVAGALLIAFVARTSDDVEPLKAEVTKLTADICKRFNVPVRFRIFAPAATETLRGFLGR